ncbi:hypothetical protein KIH39_03635 [Telmatocola sphagniphila]|uniref:Uncharacterized protein n=1 Tax=Telmatocola sphagniphila TaxID=1123043 RepID=A0A8E6B9T9_9BACT|nr:hypothetical protein [Telmatocola sphagniphila]QVL33020.1 hypothetical protein KIH39_03635 [Telmatocola sphagniphila]
MNQILEREEYIEQAYFFRVFRERMLENLPAQEILNRLHEEILTTTRLPMAIQFLATEIKHTGLLSSGFDRLGHYFTPFQTFMVKQSEQENRRFSTLTALIVLEREAVYRSNNPTPAGLFVYQFETICRNRLGYDDGLRAMEMDPIFNDNWKDYFRTVRRSVGLFEFSELVYLRSENYVTNQKKNDATFVPSIAPLFGEKEGKIARASIGRDPLFLFAALQRQLGYPEVPRPKQRDDESTKLDQMVQKVRELETRLKLMEGEMRGNVDLSQFGKPAILSDVDDLNI